MRIRGIRERERGEVSVACLPLTRIVWEFITTFTFPSLPLEHQILTTFSYKPEGFSVWPVCLSAYLDSCSFPPIVYTSESGDPSFHPFLPSLRLFNIFLNDSSSSFFPSPRLIPPSSIRRRFDATIENGTIFSSLFFNLLNSVSSECSSWKIYISSRPEFRFPLVPNKERGISYRLPRVMIIWEISLVEDRSRGWRGEEGGETLKVDTLIFNSRVEKRGNTKVSRK